MLGKFIFVVLFAISSFIDLKAQKLSFFIGNHRTSNSYGPLLLPERGFTDYGVYIRQERKIYNNRLNNFGLSYIPAKGFIKEYGLDYQNIEVSFRGPVLHYPQDLIFRKIRVHKLNFRVMLFRTQGKRAYFYAGLTLARFFAKKYSKSHSYSENTGIYLQQPDKVDITTVYNPFIIGSLELDLGFKFNLFKVAGRPVVLGTFANIWIRNTLRVGLLLPPRGTYGGDLFRNCRSLCFTLSYPIYSKQNDKEK